MLHRRHGVIGNGAATAADSVSIISDRAPECKTRMDREFSRLRSRRPAASRHGMADNYLPEAEREKETMR